MTSSNERGWRYAARATGRDLLPFDVDAVLRVLDLAVKLRHLVLEVGDARLFVGNLVGQVCSAAAV